MPEHEISDRHALSALHARRGQEMASTDLCQRPCPVQRTSDRLRKQLEILAKAQQYLTAQVSLKNAFGSVEEGNGAAGGDAEGNGAGKGEKSG